MDLILSGIRKMYANIIIVARRYVIIFPSIFRLHTLFVYNIQKKQVYYTSSRHTTNIFPLLIYTPLIYHYKLQSEFFYSKIFLIIQFRLQVFTPKLCDIIINSILFTVSKALAISRKMSKAFIS